MIKGVHAMFFSDQPDATRAFLRDKMQIPHTDVGHGWLIFDFETADMGVHPLREEGGPVSGAHQVSFLCDDLKAEVAAMQERGVEFDGEISNEGWGLSIRMNIPGGIRCQVIEPRYK